VPFETLASSFQMRQRIVCIETCRASDLTNLGGLRSLVDEPNLFERAHYGRCSKFVRSRLVEEL
jgi:hypothetical protein